MLHGATEDEIVQNSWKRYALHEPLFGLFMHCPSFEKNLTWVWFPLSGTHTFMTIHFLVTVCRLHLHTISLISTTLHESLVFHFGTVVYLYVYTTYTTVFLIKCLFLLKSCKLDGHQIWVVQFPIQETIWRENQTRKRMIQNPVKCNLNELSHYVKPDHDLL